MEEIKSFGNRKYSNCELFHFYHKHILEDVSDGYANVYDNSMDLVKSCAIEKNIEFDGYFLTRWEQSADTIINFDEEYFENSDRRDLYVFLSALVDEEIFAFLNVAFKVLDKEPVTKELIKKKIRYLTQEKGIRF